MLDIKLAKKRYTRMIRSSNRGDRVDILGNVIRCTLTFDEWLNIWLESGYYDRIGAKKGCYVMSRQDDIGDYEIGNVFIQLHTDNIKQALTGKKRKPETIKKMKVPHTGARIEKIKGGFTNEVRENLRKKALIREATKRNNKVKTEKD